jgi:hypothetical protein
LETRALPPAIFWDPEPPLSTVPQEIEAGNFFTENRPPESDYGTKPLYTAPPAGSLVQVVTDPIWSRCSMCGMASFCVVYDCGTDDVQVPLELPGRPLFFFSSSLLHFLIIDGFGTISAQLVSAPTSPEDALESLPPIQAKVIWVMCWELHILPMASRLGGLSDVGLSLGSTSNRRLALHYSSPSGLYQQAHSLYGTAGLEGASQIYS